MISRAEQDHRRWLDLARGHRNLQAVTVAMRERIDAGEWESPLIRHAVLDTYATARYGSGWKEPSGMDLVMLSVARPRT